MKTFEELRTYIGSIPFINYGGCAIAALFMYKWLRKNQPEKQAKILYMYPSYTHPYYEHNQKIISNQSKESPQACTHAAILIDDKVIDSKEEVPIDRFDLRLPIDNEDFVIKSIRCGGWNDTFDRDKWLPIMEKNIGIKLCI